MSDQAKVLVLRRLHCERCSATATTLVVRHTGFVKSEEFMLCDFHAQLAIELHKDQYSIEDKR